MEFYEYLRKIRLMKNLTVNQLAIYSGVSSATISRIENGQRGVPKPETIKKLADGLKIDYEELMRVAGYIEEAEEDVSVAGKDIKLTADELKVFEELKKHPILFHDLATDPEKKVKELIKLYRMKQMLLDDEDDDEDPGDGFGEIED